MDGSFFVGRGVECKGGQTIGFFLEETRSGTNENIVWPGGRIGDLLAR